MERISENVWGTQNPEKIRYAWMGEHCELSSNDFVEEQQGGILDFYLVTSSGYKLNPYKDWEEMNDKTIFWEIPEPQDEYWATHLSVGEYSAEITDDAIVIESLQSVFYFEKESEEERSGVIGIPDAAYKMTNDAFILIQGVGKKIKREITKKLQKKEAFRKTNDRISSTRPSTRPSPRTVAIPTYNPTS